MKVVQWVISFLLSFLIIPYQLQALSAEEKHIWKTYATVEICEKFASSTITIENKTPIDLYVAAYYTNVTSTQITLPLFLPAGKYVTLKRPKKQWGYDRQIYFSITDEVLTEELSHGQSELLPNFNIGSFADNFVIIFENGIFKGYNKYESTAQRLLETIQGPCQQFSDNMKKPLRHLYKNPYKNNTATIRTDIDISNQEKIYLTKRAIYSTKACEKITQQQNIPQDALPRIALCCSGGGYRSMISTLGSLIALEKLGLFDAVTYMAGLSGSTWLIAPWTILGIPLSEYRDQLALRINDSLVQDVYSSKMIDTLWKKFVFDEPLSIIDMYGALLGNQLLENPDHMTLSLQKPCVADGSRPYPIYTALAPEDPYEWIEFTPHEIGSTYLGGFIPTWAFGCEFENGKSTDIIPEQNLGFLMGIWGSAFSANVHEIYQEYRKEINAPVLREALDAGTSYEYFGDIRILPAKIANPYLGMLSSSRSQQKNLTLVDAGLDCNIPMPPLLRKERAIDIIIVLDNSQDVKGAPALGAAARYAKSKQLPFPPISLKNIDKKICTVFKDANNPQAPVIIYMPLIKNSNYSNFDPVTCIETSYCTTANFTYIAKEVMELSGLTEYSMQESAPIIIQEIKECIERKKKQWLQ